MNLYIITVELVFLRTFSLCLSLHLLLYNTHTCASPSFLLPCHLINFINFLLILIQTKVMLSTFFISIFVRKSSRMNFIKLKLLSKVRSFFSCKYPTEYIYCENLRRGLDTFFKRNHHFQPQLYVNFEWFVMMGQALKHIKQMSSA